MAYRLTPEESIAQGLRRVVREEVEDSTSRLRTQDRSKRDESIHEARKSIKKLRGVVRLSMPQSGDEGKRDNLALRDIGRTLSEFRDASALVETLDSLIERNPEAKELVPVRQELARRRDAAMKQEASHVMEQAIPALRAFRRRINAWKLDSDSFETIAPGLKLTYGRGRKALARARSHPTSENFHDLRKRAKDHWYHVRLLESLWTGAMEAREQSLKDLQEWLGDDHNLAVLHEKISTDSAPFGGSENVAAAIGIIEKAQKELRESSLALAERIYEEKPGAFTRRIGRLWEIWRGEPNPQPKGVKGATASPARRNRSVA